MPSVPISLALIFLVFGVASCTSTPDEPKNAIAPSEKIALSENRKGSIQLYEARPIQKKARPVIFVHGSPGEAQDWRQYAADPDLKKRFRMIAYDRPGFANSTRGLFDFEAQVSALGLILEKQDQPVILVGHSLGGALVLGAAARFPEKVDSVLALAPSVDPKPSRVLRINQFLRFTGFRLFLPSPFNASHPEVIALFPALRNLEPELAKITAPVTIVQGQRDRLVPPTSVPFLQEKLTATRPKVVLLEKEDHFLPWKQFPLIKKLLLEENPIPSK